MKKYKIKKGHMHSNFSKIKNSSQNHYTIINNQYNINYININCNTSEQFIPIEEKENYNVDNDNIILMEKNEPCMHAYIDEINYNFNTEIIYSYKAEKK
jgi:hypothetical protein